MKMVNDNGQGVILYMNQNNSCDEVIAKFKSYAATDATKPVVHKMDTRDFGIGAQILRKLGVRNIKLISNNPTKRIGLDAYGLTIVDAVPMETEKV
jgi:3,4-dihydroxy 2-butanone 4-phosphate synthase/GTP cyclohydrolase II